MNRFSLDMRDPQAVIAYVDGSCSTYRKNAAGQNRAAWGVCIMQAGRVLHEGRGEVTGPPELLAMRNVAGELKAAMEAVRWARRHRQPVVICYDYRGIERWASGDWRRRNPYTQAYHDFMKKNTRWIDGFLWVRGHSGDAGNSRADALAGAVLKPCRADQRTQPRPVGAWSDRDTISPSSASE